MPDAGGLTARAPAQTAAPTPPNPGLLPRLYTAHLYLVCCTVLLWVIMWNPDWSAGRVVCAVISDVHRTLRSHRSLPLREMGGEEEGVVCVLDSRHCAPVCVCERESYFTHVLLTYLLLSCCQQTRLAPLPDQLKPAKVTQARYVPAPCRDTPPRATWGSWEFLAPGVSTYPPDTYKKALARGTNPQGINTRLRFVFFFFFFSFSSFGVCRLFFQRSARGSLAKNMPLHGRK